MGARYVLGDRPISVTMARMWAALSGWEKARLLASLLWTGARQGRAERGLQNGTSLCKCGRTGAAARLCYARGCSKAGVRPWIALALRTVTGSSASRVTWQPGPVVRSALSSPGCTLRRSRADKQELRQEIERLKGGDALMQAVGEFAQVSCAAACMLHMQARGRGGRSHGVLQPPSWRGIRARQGRREP